MDNSGYTSINIDGNVYYLRFGIPAVRMFLQKLASDEVIISDGKVNEIGVANLIYCGYVNNCMVKDEVPTKTLGFFLEFVENMWVDEEVKNQVERVSVVYAESKFTKSLTKGVNDVLNDVKKKIEKRKQKRTGT